MDGKNDVRDFIEHTSPWLFDARIVFTREEMDLIKKCGYKRRYPKGSVILRTNDKVNDLMVINKGLVRYYILSIDGEEKTVAYSDHFLALEAIFHEQPILYNTIAMEDVEIYFVIRQNIDKIISVKSLNNKILKALSMKTRVLGWQVHDLSFYDIDKKICRMLCCYFAYKEYQNNAMISKLTHKEIANMTNLHRVTVTNAITRLKRDEVIDIDDEGHVHINNWNKLVEKGYGGLMENEGVN